MHPDDDRTVPDSFTFVMNLERISDGESHELIPGYVLRRAHSHEIEIIKDKIRLFGWANPIVDDLWDHRRGENGVLEALGTHQQRYFVIGFRGYNKHTNELTRACDIARNELELGFTIVNTRFSEDAAPITGMIYSPERMYQLLERASKAGDFFRSFSTLELASIGALYESLRKHDRNVIDVSLSAIEVGQLKALPPHSPLVFLGYFMILESMLTHSPKPGDPYDSITRQVKKKITLLNNRWSDPIDYAAFGGADSETVWGKMYAYRSQIAHGGSAQLTDQLQLLGTPQQALHLIRETVKAALRYALIEPRLIADLRDC